MTAKPSKTERTDPMELWICVHGETKNNTKARRSKIDESCGLSDTGREQVRKLAERIRRVDFEAMYSSDWKCATETTEILLSYGVTARNHADHNCLDLNVVSLDARLCDKKYHGESDEDFEARTRSFIFQMVSSHHDTAHALSRKLSRSSQPVSQSRGDDDSPPANANPSSGLWSGLKRWTEWGRRGKAAAASGGGGALGASERRARRVLVVTHARTMAEMVNAHIPAARVPRAAAPCSLAVVRVVACPPTPRSSPTLPPARLSFSSAMGGAGRHSTSWSDMNALSLSGPALDRSFTPPAPGHGACPPWLASWLALSHLQFVLVRCGDSADLDSPPAAASAVHERGGKDDVLWDEL